jgi:hypothetical protein
MLINGQRLARLVTDRELTVQSNSGAAEAAGSLCDEVRSESSEVGRTGDRIKKSLLKSIHRKPLMIDASERARFPIAAEIS